MRILDIIPQDKYKKLLTNGTLQRNALAKKKVLDFKPVIRLFTPDANASWLLSELDPDDPDSAYGVCDPGLGYPKLEWVQFEELDLVRGPMGLPIELDPSFIANKTDRAYWEEAVLEGKIVL